MPAQKPTTIVSGTVDGINIPADWKDGQYGRYKSCGIKLTNCNKPGISWINYFWNEKNKAGEEQENLFQSIRKGQTYNFICTSKVYQDKIQYSPVSYELVPSGAGHAESESTVDEHDYPETASDVPVPREIQKPVFKFISGQVMDADGNVYEVKA